MAKNYFFLTIRIELTVLELSYNSFLRFRIKIKKNFQSKYFVNVSGTYE